MTSLYKSVLYRIRGHGRGSAFTSGDFLDLGSRAAVDKALSRLCAAKTIRRIKPGLFDYPRINEKLGGMLSPDIDLVAKTVARKNGLRIQVTGAQAANLLGLTSQVPMKAIYLTDGPSKKIKLGNREISFRHIEPRRIRMSKSRSGVALEALKHFGKDGADDHIIAHLKRLLTKAELRQLRKDSAKAPLWIRELLEHPTEGNI